jgi:Spy/CpxP family protein refolding chaperone
MHTKVLRSALLAAFAGFSSLAFATAGAQTADTPTSASSAPMHRGMHHGMQRWHGSQQEHMDVLRQLDLTDTQRSHIQQMMRDEHTQSRPEMQALMQKRKALENATPGTAEYQTAAQQLGQAEAQAAQARVTRHAQMRAKIYNELTPEQRSKLASLSSEHQDRMQDWRCKRAQRPERAQRAVNEGAEAAPASTSGGQP